MAFVGYRSRTSPAALVWAGGILAFALLTLGLVHHESARRARERSAAVPLRPILIVDLESNRAARGKRPFPELEAWRAAAAELGRPVEVFDGPDLWEIPPERYAVWVLPSQARLSEDDWLALDSYLSGDGGALLTGPSGLQTEEGAEAARSPLVRLFPGEHFADPGREATRLRVVGRSPLVAGLEPGQQLELAPGDHALATVSPGALDWKGDEAGGSATLHGRHRGAPVAWLGFSVATLADPQIAERIAGNALRFAAREPLLDLRPWPDGRPCAVLVDGGSAADSSAGLCQAALAHPDDPDLDRLVHGGCRFATTAASDNVLPEVLDRGGAKLVAIPEPRPRRDAQGAALLRELLSGYEQAERMGSVFSLRSDASWRAAEGREALFASVGQELGVRGAWFARPDELADWWLARVNVDAHLERLAPDGVRVTFANHGESEALGLTARIYVPDGADTPRLESSPVLARKPLLRLATDRTWIEVVARPLDPGSEVSYTIRF